MIDSREDIRDFILEIERKFPVDEWEIDDFHIWPIIRIRLFFYLIKKTEYKELNQAKAKNSTFKQKHSFISFFKRKQLFLSLVVSYFHMLISLPKKKYLFVANDAHRVDYREKRFNRFFDVLIEAYNVEKDSLYIESINPKNKIYNSQSLRDFSQAMKGYLNLRKLRKQRLFNFKGGRYDEFLIFLKSQSITKEFAPLYTEDIMTNWYNKKFRNKIQFFYNVLKKIEPKQIMLLCYYSENNLALLVAANSLGIKTIEMQHGPQTDIHMCYGNWTKIPKKGYGALPRTYWCWDVESSTVINKWALNSKVYSATVVGHPWTTYWQNKNKGYIHKSFILYCLQPAPLTLETLFPKGILSLIESDDKIWFLRLHPRQLKDIQKIIDFFKENNLSHKVNIVDATNDPLPQLLANATLHVTNFSGSTIEASLYGKKTILLHKIGESSFQHFISSEQAFYLNPESKNFESEFRNIENNLTNAINVEKQKIDVNLF